MKIYAKYLSFLVVANLSSCFIKRFNKIDEPLILMPKTTFTTYSRIFKSLSNIINEEAVDSESVDK